MIADLLALPSHLRQRVVTGLDDGSLRVPYPMAALRAVLGGASDGHLAAVGKGLVALAVQGVADRAAASWLREVEKLEAGRPRPDFVWSGPELPGLHARDTRRVFEEILGSAERSVWASTFAFFDGPKAFAVLAKRMEEKKELRVTLLLNVHRKQGNTTAADALVRQFAEKFWGQDWPGEVKPRVFYDPGSLELASTKRVLHAKAVVADDLSVFITSANLTEAALDRNIEMGLLVRDRALAASVVAHFRGMIDQKQLLPLPVA